MLKLILYLFLIYLILRFLFGRFFRINIYTGYRQAEQHYSEQRNDRKHDGEVKISRPKSNDKKGNDQSLGEYVDYEEVK